MESTPNLSRIVVTADEHLNCDDELVRRVEGVLTGTLDSFSDSVSCVEVHLSDRDSPNPAERDKSCRLRATLLHRKAVAVCHEAATLSEAIHEAAGKLRREVVHLMHAARVAGPGKAGPVTT